MSRLRAREDAVNFIYRHFIIIIIKKGRQCQAEREWIHPISPKTPAPQYQPIDRKKRNGIKVEDYSRDRAAKAHKEALALLLKPTSHSPSNTGLVRSFQSDIEKGIKVMLTARFCSEAVQKCTDVRPEHRV